MKVEDLVKQLLKCNQELEVKGVEFQDDGEGYPPIQIEIQLFEAYEVTNELGEEVVFIPL